MSTDAATAAGPADGWAVSGLGGPPPPPPPPETVSPFDESDPDFEPDEVLRLAGVTVRRGRVHLISELDWVVRADERWVVLGPNGAGKTTTLRVAATLLPPSTGRAWVLGERLGRVNVWDLRPRIGLSSAALAERLPAEERAVDAVQSAAWAVLGRGRESYDAADEARARALLDWWGVGPLAERAFGTLSEGERKRVQISRALMTDPELLLFDEPAAGLDLGGREDLVARLATLVADPASPALVLVTHHVEEIPPGITHALLLRDGGVLAAGPIEQALTSATLTACFGMGLDLQQASGRYWARRV